MLRAIKVRLYPNKGQEETINKVLGSYRFVYNHILAKKQQEYEENGNSWGLKELSQYFYGTMLTDEQYAWLKEMKCTAVFDQAIRQMLTAYDHFFNHHDGFPKFKSKKAEQSALFPLKAISMKNTFIERKITLTRQLKDIRFRCSDLYLARLQTYKAGIRSATLTKTKSGDYYLSILMDLPQEAITKFDHTGEHVGIDLGIKDFVITSDGQVFENKHFFTSQEKKIAKLYRQLSKKQKGSNNYEKQRLKLAKAYEKLVNQKEAYIHSVANELLSHYDTVFMEDLNVNGIFKNHNLARAINEVGLGRFKQVLEYKAENNDKKIERVDRFYPSSKTCHKCGYVNKELKLRDREWTCPVCGEHHDRDLNAAINILMEGERQTEK